MAQWAGRGFAAQRAYRYLCLTALKLLSIQCLPNHCSPCFLPLSSFCLLLCFSLAFIIFPHDSGFSSFYFHLAAVMQIGVWQGVAMDSLKYHLGPPCLSFLRPAGGPPLKRTYSHFRGSPPAGRAVCGHPLPLWTPHAIRPWFAPPFSVLLSSFISLKCAETTGP
jgi:hypothetical protein